MWCSKVAHGRQAPPGRSQLLDRTIRGVALVPTARDLRLQVPRDALPRRVADLEREAGVTGAPVRGLVRVRDERDEVDDRPGSRDDGESGGHHGPSSSAPLGRGCAGPVGPQGGAPGRAAGGARYDATGRAQRMWPHRGEHQGAADGRRDRGHADEAVGEGTRHGRVRTAAEVGGDDTQGPPWWNSAMTHATITHRMASASRLDTRAARAYEGGMVRIPARPSGGAQPRRRRARQRRSAPGARPRGEATRRGAPRGHRRTRRDRRSRPACTGRGGAWREVRRTSGRRGVESPRGREPYGSTARRMTPSPEVSRDAEGEHAALQCEPARGVGLTRADEGREGHRTPDVGLVGGGIRERDDSGPSVGPRDQKKLDPTQGP